MTMEIIFVTIVGIGIAEEWSKNLNIFAHKADHNGIVFFLVCLPCGASLRPAPGLLPFLSAGRSEIFSLKTSKAQTAPKALKVTEPLVSCCWILSLPPPHWLQSCSHGLCNRWWEDIKTWWCNYAGIAKLLEKKTKNHIMLRRQKNKMERRKDTEEKRHSHQSTFYLFCLSC